MRIGLLGGSFNPPHLGHLRLAEEAASLHALERVIFIPCHIPPHKSSKEMAPAEHRLAMTRAACEGNRLFEVSDMEIQARGTSYTVDTLRTFADDTSFTPFFIMGTDSLKDIGAWKDYQTLFTLSDFIVIGRPGIEFSDAWESAPAAIKNNFRPREDRLDHDSSHSIIPSEVRGLDISSTRIRYLLENNLSIRYLVPDQVLSYIKEHRLYGC